MLQMLIRTLQYMILEEAKIMVQTITNAMLRQVIGIAAGTQTSNNNLNAGSAQVNTTEETNKISCSMKRITKVQSSTVICEDGTKAYLLSPIPGLHWKCMARADEKGLCTLAKTINGLILITEGDNYCLGISGATDEFEIRMHIGQNEVRINNEFLNLAAQHVVLNGLEVKEDDEPPEG